MSLDQLVRGWAVASGIPTLYEAWCSELRSQGIGNVAALDKRAKHENEWNNLLGHLSDALRVELKEWRAEKCSGLQQNSIAVSGHQRIYDEQPPKLEELVMGWAKGKQSKESGWMQELEDQGINDMEDLEERAEDGAMWERTLLKVSESLGVKLKKWKEAKKSRGEQPTTLKGFVHIDLSCCGTVRQGQMTRVGRCINEFMLRKGFDDPRVATRSSADILEGRGETLETVKLRELRELTETRYRYELWRIRDFNPDALVQYIRQQLSLEKRMGMMLRLWIMQDTEGLLLTFPLSHIPTEGDRHEVVSNSDAIERSDPANDDSQEEVETAFSHLTVSEPGEVVQQASEETAGNRGQHDPATDQCQRPNPGTSDGRGWRSRNLRTNERDEL